MPVEKCAIKIPLVFESEKMRILDGHSNICIWLYNQLLEKASQLKEAYKTSQDPQIGKQLYSPRGLRNLVPKMKQEHPFLKVVHSSVLKNVALRLTDAIKRQKESKKNTYKIKWPRFKSRKVEWFSLFYDEPTKGFYVEGNTLHLSLGMGEDRKQKSLELQLKEAALLKDKKIRNLRIICELDLYYAVFTIEKSLVETKEIKKIIACDPNHKNFFYGVDVEGHAIEVASPKWLKSRDAQLDELQAKRDRCDKKSCKVEITDKQGSATGKYYYKPSRRWKSLDRALKKSYRKRREQTKTFMFTLAHQLVASYDCIGIGDYAPKKLGYSTKMRRAMNNRSLHGKFKDVLSWVGKKSGKTVIVYDEKGTTKTCHDCHTELQSSLKPCIRKWQCPGCGRKHHRDENAAINGLERVLTHLEKNQGMYVPTVSCSDLAIQKRCAWRVSTSGVKLLRGRNSEKQLTATRN